MLYVKMISTLLSGMAPFQVFNQFKLCLPSVNFLGRISLVVTLICITVKCMLYTGPEIVFNINIYFTYILE